MNLKDKRVQLFIEPASTCKNRISSRQRSLFDHLHLHDYAFKIYNKLYCTVCLEINQKSLKTRNNAFKLNQLNRNSRKNFPKLSYF